MSDLISRLEQGNLFKLVLGAANECNESIRKNVEIYAETDVDIFDLNPSEKAIKTVFQTISDCNKNPDDYLYCVSLVAKGDKHYQKAVVDNNRCATCGTCIGMCPQGAIYFDGEVKVDEKKCIGCEQCHCDCISYESKTEIELSKALDIIKQYKIDMIELHISTTNIDDIFSKWQKIIANFDGILSICADRANFSNKQLLDVLSKMIKMAGRERVIIQADGNPMSGGEDTYEPTLQAVACADLVKDLGTYIFISGGTNSKTPELAKLCNVRYNGITVGSYARKIIKTDSRSTAIENACEFVNIIKSRHSEPLGDDLHKLYNPSQCLRMTED